jgi:hypothetical protein
MRLLIAYGREFTRPRRYRLEDLARAAGMSISGVRTAYDDNEVAEVARLTGADVYPVTSASAESQDPTSTGLPHRDRQSEDGLFRDPDGPVAVTQRSSARYRHWPFRCCSSHEAAQARGRRGGGEGIAARADARTPVAAAPLPGARGSYVQRMWS